MCRKVPGWLTSISIVIFFCFLRAWVPAQIRNCRSSVVWSRWNHSTNRCYLFWEKDSGRTNKEKRSYVLLLMINIIFADQSILGPMYKSTQSTIFNFAEHDNHHCNLKPHNLNLCLTDCVPLKHGLTYNNIIESTF